MDEDYRKYTSTRYYIGPNKSTENGSNGFPHEEPSTRSTPLWKTMGTFDLCGLEVTDLKDDYLEENAVKFKFEDIFGHFWVNVGNTDHPQCLSFGERVDISYKEININGYKQNWIISMSSSSCSPYSSQLSYSSPDSTDSYDPAFEA